MSSESGPDDRKEPELGPAQPEEESHAAPDIDPEEPLSNTEPDRLPPWLGMPDDDVKVSKFRPGLIAAAVGVLIVFGGIVWVVYHQAGEDENQQPPVITADNQPTKVQPESPGGTSVPNQDNTVYDRINPNAPEKPEHILPPAEEPQGLQPSQPSGSEPGGAQTAQQTPPAQTTPAPKEVAPPPPQPVTEAAPKPAPTPKTTPAPTPKVPPAAISSSSYLIQLGAFGDDAGANRAWKTLQRKYSSVLGGLSSDIQRADLGAKGVFHRLRAGPFSSRADAEAACKALKAKKQGCLVVAP